MDQQKQIYFVKDRHPRISEVLNDCIGGLCVQTYTNEPLSSILKKICAKITTVENDDSCCYTADDGLTLVNNTLKLGQPWGTTGNPAMMTEDREIPLVSASNPGGTKFRLIGPPYVAPTGAPSASASSMLLIDLGNPGTPSDTGKVCLNSQSLSGVGFNYIGMDPGFVRNNVDNTWNPTDAIPYLPGLPYELGAVGYSMRNTYENKLTQIFMGVTGNTFADNSLMIRTTSGGISLAVDGTGFINFRGSPFYNASEYGRFAATTGYFGLGTATPTARLDVNSDVIRLRTAKTPSSAADTGNTGDICWDANFLYVCVSANNWKRVAISTF